MKKRSLILLSFIALLFLNMSAAAQTVTPRNPQVEKILQEISPGSIKLIIEKLASFGTRHTVSATDSDTRGIGAARRCIKSELEKYSKENGGRLKVELDSFMIDPGDLPPRYAQRIPRPTEIVNIVATLPGSRPESSSRIYVVSGHYDSMCTPYTSIACDAPGADDDASGIAVSMELARVMSRYQFDATLVFLAVAGEEQGLIGSTHWARAAKEKKMNIAGMLNDDMVGNIRSGDGEVQSQVVRIFSEGMPANATDAERRVIETIGGENDSPSRQLARYVVETAERYLPAFRVMPIYRSDRYGRGGDHTPFNENGYAAVRLTEYYEDFNHQHQAPRVENGIPYGDLPEFVSFDYVTRVARVNAATLASLALAPASPENVRFGSTRQAYDTVIQWAPGQDPGLAGYIIVWRETTSPVWQNSLFVGSVRQYTLQGLSKDNLIFGVRAVSKSGDLSPVVVPRPSLPARAATERQ